MNKADVKKVFHKMISELPNDKALVGPDIQVKFENLTGQSINDHLDIVNEVINELHNEKVLICDTLPNGMSKISKGFNFDKLESEMNPQSSNSHINISSLNAQNVQVGNQNNMNISITAEQFANALSTLANKPPKESQSIVEKIASYVKDGASLAEAVSELIGLISN